MAFAPIGAGENGVDQIAHCINLGQLRFGDFAAELLFEGGEQFNALHGVESKIEFEIVAGANGFERVACRFPHDGQSALYIFALQPQFLVVGERLLGTYVRVAATTLFQLANFLFDLEALELAGGGAGQVILPDVVTSKTLGGSDLVGERFNLEADSFFCS